MDAPPLEQAEFDVNDVGSEVARATLRQLMQDLNGIHAVQFLEGGAVITFNPLNITMEEIYAAIGQSGYRATEIEATATR